MYIFDSSFCSCDNKIDDIIIITFSRVALLYREKIASLAAKALNMHGTQVIIYSVCNI